MEGMHNFLSSTREEDETLTVLANILVRKVTYPIQQNKKAANS